jgi:plastocyanin
MEGVMRLPRLAAGVFGVMLAAVVAAPGVGAVTLEGVVSLSEKGKAVADAASAVVWFEPATAAPSVVPLRAEVRTRDRRFMPRVTVVPAGSEVWFPNGDPILHNVFSVSPGNRFDVGLTRKGPGRSARFATPGLVRVFCNVHQSMIAYVLVLATNFYSRPADDGHFTLEGLAEGAGTLHAWHERGGFMSQPVTLPLAEPLRIAMELEPAGTLVHLDKHGKPYAERGHDDY